MSPDSILQASPLSRVASEPCLRVAGVGVDDDAPDPLLQDHMDLASTALEPGLVHQLRDQVDPSAVSRIHVLAHDRTGDGGRVEARPGVSYDDHQVPRVAAR